MTPPNADAARQAFLERVRQAVAAGNRAGQAPLPQRGTTGYQGGGFDTVQKFCAELAAAGGQGHVVRSPAEAVECILRLACDRNAQKVLLGRGAVLDGLDLAVALAAAGHEVIAVEAFTGENCRAPFFSADLGVSQAAYLIAETGSVVALASQQDPRSVSLLPPVHIAVASSRQILSDLFDLFGVLKPGELPSCAALITGPSKTGDIELKLVTGVHGPGEVHVVVLVE